jgi:hypothetical protein
MRSEVPTGRRMKMREGFISTEAAQSYPCGGARGVPKKSCILVTGEKSLGA